MELLRVVHAERDIVIWQISPSVRPSVRLSVTLWYCIETNAHVVKLFSSSGRGILSATAVTKFQGELSLSGGVKYTGVRKI